MTLYTLKCTPIALFEAMYIDSPQTPTLYIMNETINENASSVSRHQPAALLHIFPYIQRLAATSQTRHSGKFGREYRLGLRTVTLYMCSCIF